MLVYVYIMYKNIKIVYVCICIYIYINTSTASFFDFVENNLIKGFLRVSYWVEKGRSLYIFTEAFFVVLKLKLLWYKPIITNLS